MRTFLFLWITLVFFAPSLVDRAMLAYADSTTVHLVAPFREKQASGVVIGERDAADGCRVLVGTARHVTKAKDTDSAEHITLETDTGPVAIASAWAESGDAGVLVFVVPGKCSENAYRVAIVAAEVTSRGQKVFGSGYPFGHKFFQWGAVSEPVVSMDMEDGLPVTQMSVVYPGAPGNSGGPLFDIFGRVVGVLSGGYPAAPMLAFFASAAQLREAVGKLKGWEI